MPGTLRRHRLRLRGLVQGVGFRPHIYSLALRHSLRGFVLNDKAGVLAELQGKPENLQAFEADLKAGPPPLARVDSLETQEVPCQPDEGFCILPSPPQTAPPLVSVGPDMAPCKACLDELLSPGRRFLYPFLNCTHCGPRMAACLGMPWDRPNTTLAGFPMCAACTAEYANPGDRRFHAQPIACPHCGPRLQNSLETLVSCIKEGGIVALKAAGGFQLLCDALHEASVQRLRLRKRRDGKPLAVMLPNLATAKRYAHLNALETALLQSPQRPIVLLKARLSPLGEALVRAVAPGLAHLGLCLPSTPLHYALFYEALGRPTSKIWLTKAHSLAWVATSANFSGEPLAFENEEALSKLADVADSFALHNRPIALRMDDSVLQVSAKKPQLLRRARGFVPTPLPLSWAGPPLLAVGGHQKSTFCLVHDNRAYVSQHLGDLDNPETCASFVENVQHWCKLLQLKPELLAADMHPDYFSTQWAEAEGLPCLSVQHHVAHVAATWAEHPEVKGPVLGLALDGTGFGTDGLPWGGELLLLETNDGRFAWQRVGHLKPLPLLGGNAVAREPWRMGVAALLALGEENKAIEAANRHKMPQTLLHAWKNGTLKAPLSTSLGRFFDAATNLLGLCEVASFEAEAPMLLEALAHHARRRKLVAPWPLEGFHVEKDNTIDLTCLLRPLVGFHPALFGGGVASLEGESPRQAAALWLHEAVAEALATWTSEEARRRRILCVALGGGCLQNRLLCEVLVKKLKRRGLFVLLPRQLPPNDGGICFGQAFVATKHFGQTGLGLN